MANRTDLFKIAQLIGVFVAALLVIYAFEFARADLAAGSLRVETVVLLVFIVMLGVAYYWSRRQIDS